MSKWDTNKTAGNKQLKKKDLEEQQIYSQVEE